MQSKKQDSSNVFLKKEIDDVYSKKKRFFDMHHTIVRTLQNSLKHGLPQSGMKVEVTQ
jgi:hypothetical protein